MYIRSLTKFPLLLLLLIQGCARVPQEDLATMAEVETCAPSTAESCEGIDREWWKKWGDPLLDGLIDKALSLSPTLKIAEERLKAVYQRAMQTQATLYPEIDLEIIDTWYHLSRNGFFRSLAPSVPAVVNDITVGFSFGYEFDFWGKNRDLFKAALSRVVAVTAERAQAELILTTAIAYSYMELQFLLAEKEILREIASNEAAIYALRSQRKEHALDNAIEESSAKILFLDVATLLIQVEKEIQTQVHQIKSLTGMGQEAEVDLSLSPQAIEPLALPAHLCLDLIAKRPDLVAQKALVESHAKEIGAARKDFYPNINLNALIGLESITFSKLFQPSSYSATITPAFNLPIFTAGRLKAQLKERVAEFNQAVYGYNQLILTASQEVADRLTDLRLLEKEEKKRSAALEEALSILSRRERRFQHGIDDQMAIYLAKTRLLQQRLSLTSLRYSRQMSFILLMRALGGGYDE